jgi:hypothetical protein
MRQINSLAPQQRRNIANILDGAQQPCIAWVWRLENWHTSLVQHLDELARAAAIWVIVARHNYIGLVAARVDMLQHIQLEHLHPAKHIGIVKICHSVRRVCCTSM